jgi:hypothetical protein
MKIFYTIRDCGDGSAAVSFYKDAELAKRGCDVEQAFGERYGGFAENYVHELDTDADGDFTTEADILELEKDLVE